MPRPLCSKCHYPEKVCVCPWVNRVDSPVNIVILQHYRESDHAKNTVRLAQLAIPEIDVQVVKPESDLQQVVNLQDDGACAVFFPTADSRPLEQNLSRFYANPYQKLVFLDGSWKQTSGIAHKMTSSPGLHFFHFVHPPPSRYQIRHTQQACALSTIEAIALVLEKAYSINTQPLTELLEAFQSYWRGPISHRRKN